MYHKGEREVQRRVGIGDRVWGSASVGASIPPVAQEFLAQQHMVVVGATGGGGVWASILSGSPGFTTAVNDRTIVVAKPFSQADPLVGSFDAPEDIGLIAIEPSTRRRMRVNGRAYREGDRLIVHTNQVYANCPKYIQTRSVHHTHTATSARPVRIADQLTHDQRRWIANADTFFVASRADELGADASHRGGNPGFVRVTGDTQLTWPDYTGNSMYMTLGNLELDPRCGLLFLDWERGNTLHLTGRAYVDWDEGRAAAVPGAQRLVNFEVERVVEIADNSPLRWSFEKYSKFNPDSKEIHANPC